MADAEEGWQELSFGAGLGDGAGGSRALQVSLPAQLGQEPEDLQRIRCGSGVRGERAEVLGSCWGGASTASSAGSRGGAPTLPPHLLMPTRRDGLFAGSRQHRQPPAKQRRVLVVPQQGDAAAPAAATATAPAPAVPGARTPLAARNAWRKQPAAPLRPAAGGRVAGGATAPRTPPPAGVPLLPAGPTPVDAGSALTPAGRQCPVPAPRPSAEEQPAGRERCLPDAGLFAGAAFRSGWAPNAVVAHAGGRAASAAHVVVRQLTVGARVAPAGEPTTQDSPFQQRQREALEAALLLHIQHSSPDAAAAGPEDGTAMVEADGEQPAAAGVPQWRLRCRRQEQLSQLCAHYIELCQAASAEVGDGMRLRVAARVALPGAPTQPRAPPDPARPPAPLLRRRRAWSARYCATRRPPGSCCTCCLRPLRASPAAATSRRRPGAVWARTRRSCGWTAWPRSSAVPG